ncbi:MAG: AraC family transcriptional regulator [Pseudomonadota bacterium]|nr:AraC family transcriptional regulator [Pseudomonadota bacterium]MEE3071435.1 AraC family transcriptional regulator [Pseudomonadota bacterium]
MNRALLYNPMKAGGWTLADGSEPIRTSTLNQFTQGPEWKRNALRGYNDHLLIWITRGQGRMILGGLRSGFGAHNAILVPAGTMVRFETSGQLFGTVIRIAPVLDVELPVDPVHMRIRNTVAQCEMTSFVDALVAEQERKSNGHERASACLLGLISVWLSRQMIEDPQCDPRLQENDVQLIRAYSRMVETDHCTDKTVADYADVLGISTEKLDQICLTNAEQSAETILKNRKHLCACERLAESDVEICKVAETLGYGSETSFAELFLNQSGISPDSFRQKFREAA